MTLKQLTIFLLFVFSVSFGLAQSPGDFLTTLIGRKWRVDRRRVNLTDPKPDSLYSFNDFGKVPSNNLDVKYRGNQPDEFTWTEIRGPEVRISIIFRPGTPPIIFQYSQEQSTPEKLVFVGLPDANTPQERYCYKITLYK
jgi:hypothetical protein